MLLKMQRRSLAFLLALILLLSTFVSVAVVPASAAEVDAADAAAAADVAEIAAEAEAAEVSADLEVAAEAAVVDAAAVAATYSCTVNNSSDAAITVNGSALNGDSVAVSVDSAQGLALTVTPDSGFGFYGWINATTHETLSGLADTVIYPEGNITIVPVLYETDGTAYYGVSQPGFDGEAGFNTMSHALDYIEELGYNYGYDEFIITVLDDVDYTENCTIPSGTTLLVPFDDAHTLYTDEPEAVIVYEQPSAFVTMTMKPNSKLTFEDGAALSVGGKLCAKGQGANSWAGAPTGPDGRICMEGDSEIVIGDGAALYAWGYIYRSGAASEGTVTAMSGATVYELFQIRNWRGGSNSLNLYNSGSFPFNQYYVQNIEVPLKIMAGASEMCYSALFVGGSPLPAPVEFIGPNGLFHITSGYLIKDYLENEDRLDVHICGDSELSSLTVSASAAGTEVTLDSANFTLPITNNISINVDSGTTNINQSVALLPGVEFNVGEDSVVTIAENKEVYVYDSEQWEDQSYALPGQDFVSIGYSAANGSTTVRSDSDLVDAKVDINGTVEVNGGFYASDTADVSSSNNTGKIHYNTNADSTAELYESPNGSSTATAVSFGAVQLRQEDGTYVSTADGSGFANNDFEYSDEGANEGSIVTYTKYLVTWFDQQGYEICFDRYREGEHPVYSGETPTAENDQQYVYGAFLGWTDDEDDVDTYKVADGAQFPAVGIEEIDYYPVFAKSERAYDVVWLDFYGDTQHTETGVDYSDINFNAFTDIPAVVEDLSGSFNAQSDFGMSSLAAEYSGKAMKSINDFSGSWTADYDYEDDSATGVCTLTPQYTARETRYLVLFVDSNYTSVLDAEYYPQATNIVPAQAYGGSTPTKAPDGTYAYTFAGWYNAYTKETYATDSETALRVYNPTTKANSNRNTYVAVYDSIEIPPITSNSIQHSLSLNGKIGVNFYVNVPVGYDPADLTMDFAWGNKFISANTYSESEQYTLNNVSGTQTDDGLKFSVPVAAKELNDDISVSLKYNGTEIYTETYRGTDYAYTILCSGTAKGYTNEQFGALYELVKNMLIYSAYAQTIFEYNTDDLATYGFANLGIDTDYRGLPSFNVDGLTGNSNLDNLPDFLQFYGSSLNLGSETSFMVIIYNEEEYWIDASAKYSGTDESVNYVYKRLGPASTIDIVNIPIARLLDSVDLTVKAGGITSNITVNAGSFIKEILREGSTYDDDLKGTAASLYWYHRSAVNFFDLID